MPSTDSERDLGTSALQWAEAHIDTGHIDNITSTGTVSASAGTIEDITAEHLTLTSLDALAMAASTAAHSVLVQTTADGIVKLESYADLISGSCGNGLNINASTKRLEILSMEEHFTSASANEGKTFTLEVVPAHSASVSVYVNGIFQAQAVAGGHGSANGDYALSGKTITLVNANVLDASDELVVKYIRK